MLTDRLQVPGRVAIVTGGGGGIGSACARALAEQGADVVVTARSRGPLEEVAAEITAMGRRALVVPADLTDLTTLPGVVDAAVEAFGRIDILVNTIGGGAPPKPFLDMTAEDLEASFRINTTVAFELSRLCVPHMLRAGGGSIVHISSAMGRLRDRGFTAYCTTKAALEHLTSVMAVDLAPRIRVNAVAPGSILTTALEGVLDAASQERMVAMTPLRRLGAPDEIAMAVLFLATDAGSYVTGKVLEVDGGIEAPTLPLGFPDLV